MGAKYNYFSLANQRNKISDVDDVKFFPMEKIAEMYVAKKAKIYEDKPYFLEVIDDSEFFITKEDKKIINCKFVFLGEFEQKAICSSFALNPGYNVLLVDYLNVEGKELQNEEWAEDLKIATGHYLLSRRGY